MAAGCLAKAGYFMGEQLLPPRSANPKGLFEDEEINDINEQILARVLPSGISMYGNLFQPRGAGERPRWLACLPLGISLTPTLELIARIQRATRNVPFCYKDPRFCYTLPVWAPFLKDTTVVCVFRSAAVTVVSTLKECAEVEALQQLNISYRRALEIWYQMYSHVLQHRQSGGQWLLLHYDQILKGDGLDKLAAATGAIVDRSFPDSTLARTQTRQPIRSKYLELYRELCHLAEYQEGDVALSTSPNVIVSSPIRLLVVAHSSQYGGAENVLHELVKGLGRWGIRPLVVFPDAGPMEKALHNFGVQTEIMDVSWCVGFNDYDSEHYLRYASNLKKRVYALAELIQREQINLVITNTAVVLEGALAARLSGAQHVWYVHEMLSRDPVLTTPVPLVPFNALLESLTDKIVVVSHAVKRELEQFVTTDKIEVVYTGIDFAAPAESSNLRSALFGWDETVPTICFVGVQSERKGVLNLVEAATAIVEEFPQVQFVLAGCETDHSLLVRQRIQEKNLQEHFHIVGFRQDALDIIAGSDILVLPSLADAFPLTVLEAMHLGKPVVATRSGGATELVVDGATGWLVPINDSQALANAVISLLSSHETRQRFGKQAKERVQTMFGYEPYITNWRRVLTDVTCQRQELPDGLAPELIDALLTLFDGAATDMIEQRGAISALTNQLDALTNRLDRIHNHPLYKVYRAMRPVLSIIDRTR
jgi:glycosyltransferase involved in cell wall biosynthesis